MFSRIGFEIGLMAKVWSNPKLSRSGISARNRVMAKVWSNPKLSRSGVEIGLCQRYDWDQSYRAVGQRYDRVQSYRVVNSGREIRLSVLRSGLEIGLWQRYDRTQSYCAVGSKSGNGKAITQWTHIRWDQIRLI